MTELRSHLLKTLPTGLDRFHEPVYWGDVWFLDDGTEYSYRNRRACTIGVDDPSWPERSWWQRRRTKRGYRRVSRVQERHFLLLDEILLAVEQIAGREPLDLHQILWEAAGDIGTAAGFARSLNALWSEVLRREKIAAESERLDSSSLSQLESQVAVRLRRVREENQAREEAVAWLVEQRRELGASR